MERLSVKKSESELPVRVRYFWMTAYILSIISGGGSVLG
jgi:hypothetical protein